MTAPHTIDLRTTEPADQPRVLAVTHRDLPVGREVTVRGSTVDLVVGGGFVPRDERRGVLHARRDRTLPDWVGPAMRLLVVGLNPSVYAADAGVGFARPGNRFWPAALAAAIVSVDRDPRHALDRHGVGMTDLVKRATARADEIDRDEFRDGAARVEALVELLEPGVVCIVGLSGWRAAIDRRASPGAQAAPFGGRPVYVMPNTSGINTRSDLVTLTDHLRAASRLADTG